MQWDIGYGRFSGGLTFRPKLEVIYTLGEVRLEMSAQNIVTVSKSGIEEAELNIGYDDGGDRTYGCIEFDLSQMPDMENTVISEAYVELEAQNIKAKKNLRYHVELVKTCDGTAKSFEAIKERDIVERIGYDVSVETLKNQQIQRFIFDRFATEEMIAAVEAGERLFFVLYATSESSLCKSQSVEWVDVKGKNRPRLIIDYIKRRRTGVAPVTNLRYSLDKKMIRLDWDNPDDDAFKGVIVVKNAFRIPSTPYDGQKLYGGSDNYTYDNFGDKDTQKFYAVFTYDDVPNFSEVTYKEYRP
jgi:hypothetical protein